MAVIGGGPAGLMAADVLSAHGMHVDVYDSMPSLGRKFLMAGKGGLNLTHSEPFEKFVARYGKKSQIVEKWLMDFSPEDLRAWARELGVETFVGTSGRVFPVAMKASPLLRAWLKRLGAAGVTVHPRHRWVGWDADKSLTFETPDGIKTVKAEAVVLTFGEFHQQGEFIVTKEGVEGSLIYAASARIRDEIEARGKAVIALDMLPDKTEAQVLEKLSKPRGARTMASHLEKTVNLKGVKAGLLREFVSKDDFADMARLAGWIKRLPVPLVAARPLDEAISSAGGVTFESLDEHLMIKKIPGVFCAGEMLDWEAPTGGYLITACMASGRVAGLGAMRWLDR